MLRSPHAACRDDAVEAVHPALNVPLSGDWPAGAAHRERLAHAVAPDVLDRLRSDPDVSVRTVAALQPLEECDAESVRLAAGCEIGGLPMPEARAVLDGHLVGETSAWFREEVDAARREPGP